jgi:photosystem II PsbU protein
MKRLFGLVAALVMLVSAWGGWLLPQSALASPSAVLAAGFRNAVDDKLSTEFGSKIDLNNTNINAFTKYARKLVKNSPYDTVDDALKLPIWSDQELERLRANVDNFTVSEPDPALVEGGDRFNNGAYK